MYIYNYNIQINNIQINKHCQKSSGIYTLTAYANNPRPDILLPCQDYHHHPWVRELYKL